MQENLFNVLLSFLKKENIHLNQDELKLQLLSHSSYPSLHAITGVLDHFSIDNIALELPKEHEILIQLPKYFIAHINSQQKEEFVLVNQLENRIAIVYSNKKKNKIAIEDFLEIWSGIIIAAEKDNNTVSGKTINNKLTSIFFYSLIGILMLGVFFYTKPSLLSSLHFILSVIGVSLSVLIVKHEFGFQSKTLDRICSVSEDTSCDAVLNSKGASIFNNIKLSDISLLYFVGLTFTWLIYVNLDLTITAIIFLTLMALPITFYSIYYQYQIVKKWCPLCLGIVAVLWLQCCTLLFNETVIPSMKLDYTSSFVLFFSFSFTTSLWVFIKPLLKKQEQLEQLEIEHYKFKRNFDLFNSVYSKGESLDTNSINSSEIILGNKNAPLRILMVTNPSCFYCKEAHIDLEEIIKRNLKNINLTIRFNVPQEESNIANQVAKRLLEIYTESEERCRVALHEVYLDDADLNQWLVKWGTSANTIYSNLLEAQQNWCHTNKIHFTPALYVNGKQFPKEYQRSDLSYFIEDLIEQEESKQIHTEENQLV